MARDPSMTGTSISPPSAACEKSAAAPGTARSHSSSLKDGMRTDRDMDIEVAVSCPRRRRPRPHPRGGCACRPRRRQGSAPEDCARGPPWRRRGRPGRGCGLHGRRRRRLGKPARRERNPAAPAPCPCRRRSYRYPLWRFLALGTGALARLAVDASLHPDLHLGTEEGLAEIDLDIGADIPTHARRPPAGARTSPRRPMKSPNIWSKMSPKPPAWESSRSPPRRDRPRRRSRRPHARSDHKRRASDRLSGPHRPHLRL